MFLKKSTTTVLATVCGDALIWARFRPLSAKFSLPIFSSAPRSLPNWEGKNQALEAHFRTWRNHNMPEGPSLTVADMGTTQNIFDSNQLSIRKFWFDWTHDSQWLYRNWFKSAHDSKWISETWFKSTLDSKSFKNILIQINSWLKKLSRILIQINSWLTKIWNIDLNQVTTQWFESSVDFVELFWAFAQFRWPFLGFH